VVHRRNIGELTENRALIAHCREVIGEDAEKLSDEEIDELRRNAEDMARILISLFPGRASQVDGTCVERER
jgi:hypothetical protein